MEFGQVGYLASESKSPDDLLTRNLIIPAGFFGFLVVKENVPFRITSLSDKSNTAISLNALSLVLSHEENVRRFSYYVVTDPNTSS